MEQTLTLGLWLHAHGWRGPLTREVLAGGSISSTVRLTRSDGACLVVKQNRQGPVGLFAAEAEGLTAIRTAGAVRVPHTLHVGPDYLILQDVGSIRPTPADWETLGRGMARQHLLTNDQFGFNSDNYLGRLRQHNPWTESGYEFFAEHRMLRFLNEPMVAAVLDANDRRQLEHLARRLPSLIPAQPASLLHGDLWWANVLGSADPRRASGPVVFDPACYYGWAEADLSMLWSYGSVSPSFWAAYQEIRPLAPEWERRMELLHVREHLSMIAHFGNKHHSYEALITTLGRW